jgi:purine-binding chemotaxis protein CheW
MSENLDNTRKEVAKDKSGESKQFLTFNVMDEEYGVDIMTVREIKGWTETTRLPNSPEFMRGVMNLRGIIIPIFDLRSRFHSELTKASAKHVVIILAVGDRNIGILVDAVSDILTVNSTEVKPAPEVKGQIKVDENYINGLISIEERMVVLLNVENLFKTEIAEVEVA